jgi:hypothetical protein
MSLTVTRKQDHRARAGKKGRRFAPAAEVIGRRNAPRMEHSISSKKQAIIRIDVGGTTINGSDRGDTACLDMALTRKFIPESRGIS